MGAQPGYRLCEGEERGMTGDHNLAVALRLAAVGLHVFPCRSDNKRPAIADWDENSTTDPARIRAWWRVRHGALVGLDLRKCGLVVIDADRHGGPDGVAAWEALVREHGADLSRQPMARTPSDGLHIYFIQPDDDSLGNREGSLPKGINIRGAGGYVIAPYCVRAEGTFYEPIAGSPDLIEAFRAKAIPPIPKWLVDLIRAEPVTPATATILRPNFSKASGNRCRAYAQAALQGQIIAVSATPSGGRNIALNSAAFRLGRMLAREWIGRSDIEQGLRFAAQECGLIADDGEHSVNATIQSGLCAGLTKPAAFPGSRR
jgi:hypothetical protein